MEKARNSSEFPGDTEPSERKARLREFEGPEASRDPLEQIKRALPDGPDQLKDNLCRGKNKQRYRKYLLHVSKKAVGNWQEIGIQLGINDNDLTRLSNDHSAGGSREQAYQMLVYWMNSDKNPTLERLLTALIDAELAEVAEDVSDVLTKEHHKSRGGKPVTEALLNTITKDIVDVWKFLGRYLGIDENTIHSITMDNRDNTWKQARRMLMKWKKSNASRATSQVLISALEDVGKTNVANFVQVRTSFNLSDNQKRWIVVGICLNKTLLPDLRDFLAPEMIKHYDDLKTKQNIDQQDLAKHLMTDGGYNFNYGSINNNEGKKKANPLFDFNVKSEVDLGKLYLKPFMAKFTGFDDTCDLSAVLGILSSASVFSSDVQDSVRKVRDDVRNEWAHCDFLTWDEAKFTGSLQLMDSLIRELKLPSDKEKRITDELKDWEARGMDLNIMDTDGLLEFVQYGEVEIERLSQEVKRLGRSQEEGTKQITEALLSIREAFDKDKEEIYEAVEANKRAIDDNKRDIEEMKMNNKERLKKVEALEETMETLKVNTGKPAEPGPASPGPPGNAVFQELVSIIGEQDLPSINATTAADKVADYLQLNKSSMADPPDDVKQKCRAFCVQLKERGRDDIIKELRKRLPSGITGPLLDDKTLYQDLDFRTKRDLTRALCGNDLWKCLASKLGVPSGHLGYYEIQLNPAEAVLEDENKKKLLTVGELYDKLVLCDAAGFADTCL